MIRSLPLVLLCLALAPGAQADWSSDVRVTTHPAVSSTQTDGGGNAVCSGEDLWVVWTDGRAGNAEIWFRERLGATWMSPERLTSDPAISQFPAIGQMPGGELRVVWQDHRSGRPEIWAKRRSVGGAWSADTCLTCDAFVSELPAMDHTGEHFVWSDMRDGNREIYYRHWADTGTLDPPFRISNDANDSHWASVASPHVVEYVPFTGAGELVLVTWTDDRDGNDEIYARFFDGSTWGAESRVSFNAGRSTHSSGAVEWSGGHLPFPEHFAAWQDDRHGNEEIYMAQGDFGTWSTPWRVTTTPELSIHPSLSTAFHQVLDPFGVASLPSPLLAWEERAAIGGPGEIRAWDLGDGSSSDVVTDSTAFPSDPTIASYHEVPSGERIFEVVWTDLRDGNEEIYESRKVGMLEAVDARTGLPGNGASTFLEPARPNPFRASTSFTVRLEREAELRVQVHDAAGRLVRELFDGRRPAGNHRFAWDGRDEQGRSAASGVYFAVARSEGEEARQKIVRIRGS